MGSPASNNSSTPSPQGKTSPLSIRFFTSENTVGTIAISAYLTILFL